MNTTWYWVHYLKLSVPLLFYFIFLIGFKTLIERVPILQQPAYKHILFLAKSTVHLLIILISLIMGLNMFGIDVQGIVAGLGLMSFAIGLALKDIITSALSSYALLVYKPFNIGDEISIKGITGTVSKMDMRYIILDTPQETFLIPNSQVMAEIVALKKESCD